MRSSGPCFCTLGSARPPTAATAAATTTESASACRGSRPRRRDQRAYHRDDDDRLLVEEVSRTRKSGLHRTSSAMRACASALTASISAIAARPRPGPAGPRTSQRRRRAARRPIAASPPPPAVRHRRRQGHARDQQAHQPAAPRLGDDNGRPRSSSGKPCHSAAALGLVEDVGKLSSIRYRPMAMMSHAATAAAIMAPRAGTRDAVSRRAAARRRPSARPTREGREDHDDQAGHTRGHQRPPGPDGPGPAPRCTRQQGNDRAEHQTETQSEPGGPSLHHARAFPNCLRHRRPRPRVPRRPRR